MSCYGKHNYTKVMGKHQLFLCLGGNLGNKDEIFSKTSDLIKRKIGDELAASSVYSAQPWGFESESEFRNQVIIVETSLSPHDVLKEIRKIEDYFGRERLPGVYLSREMDIDILFYDFLINDSKELVIPHPLIAYRRFVLVPLAEISPGFIHPVTGKSIAEMLDECKDLSRVNKI